VRSRVAEITADEDRPAREPRSTNTAPEYGALKDGALKEHFKDCLRRRSPATDSLPALILVLVHRGVSRATLTRWGTGCGRGKSYVRSLLSRIFVKLGLRKRREGAGRKVSAAALELLTHARQRYGRSFRSVLHSACRLVDSQTAAQHRQQPHRGATAPYCHTAISGLPASETKLISN